MAIHSFAPLTDQQSVNRFGKGNMLSAAYQPSQSYTPFSSPLPDVPVGNATRKYRITSPDGRRFDVTGSGSKDEALAHLQGQLGYDQSATPQTQTNPVPQYEPQKLATALRNAHDAGDVNAAKRIAGMIQAQQQSSPDLAKVKRNIQRMIDQNAPESDIDAYVASEGTTPEQLRGTPAAPEPQWGDLPGNILPSMGNAAMGFYQAIRHPIETSNAIDQMIGGGVANVNDKIYGMLPDAVSGPLRSFDNAVAPWTPFASVQMQANPQQRQQAQQVAGAVGGMMKDRYGGASNIKRTLIQDPFGAALDASALLTGGGSLAAKIPMAGNLSKGLLAAGRMTDPIALTGKALRKGSEAAGVASSYPLSIMTGASPDAIQTAYRSGKQGGEAGDAFRQNMRGREGADAVVNEARTALDAMADTRRGDYLHNMQSTHASSMQIDPTPIYSALDDLRNSLHVQPRMQPGNNAASFGPLPKGTPEEFAALDEIETLMNQWAAHPEGLTPAGLDALKQRISRMQPSPTAQNANNLRRIVTAAENAVKDSIVQAVPEYGKAMEAYATSKAATDEITKALSLGRTASIDTAAAKLKSALGGNRKTRAESLATLEANGASNLMPRIAGQQLSDVMPRGLLGKAVGSILGGSAYFNPSSLAVLPMTSPRFVGEIAHAIGRGTRHTGNVYGKGHRAVVAATVAGRGNVATDKARADAMAKAKRFNDFLAGIK